MTSPYMTSVNFTGEIVLPNNKNCSLSIFIPNEDENEDLRKGKRKISLYVDEVVTDRDTEEIIIFPLIEHLGEYDEETIIRSFHKDDIEFI